MTTIEGYRVVSEVRHRLALGLNYLDAATGVVLQAELDATIEAIDARSVMLSMTAKPSGAAIVLTRRTASLFAGVAGSVAQTLVRLTPRLARGAIRHALREAGYLDTRSRLASLTARARSSAALPEVGLRTLHSSGQTLRLTPTSDDPYRYTQAGTSELALEARLTWHLDRLVFADEEVPVERLQHERDAAERRLIDYVLQRLLTWNRGRVRAADPNLDPDQRQTAALEALGAAVELDVLTGGWFSWAIGESVGQGAGAAGESAKVEVNTPRHAR